jgi:hypothetical protein
MGYALPGEEHGKGGKSSHLAIYGPELAPLLEERLLRIAARCWKAGLPGEGIEKEEG